MLSSQPRLPLIATSLFRLLLGKRARGNVITVGRGKEIRWGHEATRVSGGEGGIRTHGRLRDTRSPGVPDRPLQHLSLASTYYDSLSEPQYGSHELSHGYAQCGHENDKGDRCLELRMASVAEERMNTEGKDAGQTENEREYLAGQ